MGAEHLMLCYFTEWNKYLCCKQIDFYAEMMKKTILDDRDYI